MSSEKGATGIETSAGAAGLSHFSPGAPGLTSHFTPSAGDAGWVRSVGIVAIAAGLMAIGAVMTFSAGASADRPLLRWPIWGTPGVRQLAFILAGLLAMLVTSRIDYRVWCAGRGLFGVAVLIVALGVLGLVFVPGVGVEVNGARRWVQVPGSDLRFQPSEFLKAALPMFLAGWLVYRAEVGLFWRGLLPVLMVVGLCAGVVGLEDFGTAALLAAVAGGLLLFAGARWLHLLPMALPAAAAFGYLIWSRPNRIDRLKTFLDPWSDPEGKGYQIIQSLCTIAGGGWWGRGLGSGFVKGYLPEARNDFIFAVICEELGIVGAAAVIGLLVVLMWQCGAVIRRCGDPVGRMLALGVGLTIGLQAAMNIAVVTASVPTKGISLPLVSAGGSGAIVIGALVGILASVARGVRSEKSMTKSE